MQEVLAFALYFETHTKGQMKMNKYGQAEYAYGIMKMIAEKLLSQGTLTEQQFKQLDKLNKEDCLSQFCTALMA